ncbi:RHS repeat-associated core domain-containing protein [Xanthocytophaga agilis]|uniref:RHS repeat-associated core domain-containing protein n=1 Tax=Xanthocytophaga agilis TaxID=3048010 RepID=A0AAE3UCS2_9BACT|nr:RHS repeat-associated core domain-containing protein [Xanthocytophaga agilis]MDJ1501163.1 RHS repeat-associated core domain-containing protein [Xanthocytophaga agilis]
MAQNPTGPNPYVEINYGSSFCVNEEASFTLRDLPCGNLPLYWTMRGLSSGVDYQEVSSDNGKSTATTYRIRFLREVKNKSVAQVNWGNSGSCSSVTGFYRESAEFLAYNAPTVTLSGPTSVQCPGEELTLTATGGGTYVWSGDAEASGFKTATIAVHPKVTTVYTVQVYGSGGCASSKSITVQVRVPVATAGVITGASTIEVGGGNNQGVLTLEGYSGTITRWEKSEDNGVTWIDLGNSGQPSYTYKDLLTTTIYRVIVTGTDNCSVASTNATVLIEQRMNWVETRTFNKTLVTTTTGSGPIDNNAQYSAEPITLPKPLIITANTTYVSAQKITVPANSGQIRVAGGGSLTLEIKERQSYGTEIRDEYITSESRAYFDYGGNPLQSQSRVMSTKTPEQDPDQAEIMVAQPLYGRYYNTVGQTLAAPVGIGGFRYISRFATSSSVPYNYTHFDTQEGGQDRINNPLPVDASSPLGKYYSDQNDREPYVATSSYPFSRTEAYGDGSGEMKRSGGVGDELRMGNGHDSYSGAFPVTTELDHYLRVRSIILPAAQNNPVTFANNAVKQVGIDVNQREGVSFSDNNGKAIASCLTGRDFTEQTIVPKITIGVPIYWSNITPVGNSTVSISGKGKIQVYQYVVISNQVALSKSYEGAAPFTFTSINGGPITIRYQIRSTETFTVQTTTSTGVISNSTANSPSGNYTTSRIHIPDANGNVPVTITNNLSANLTYVVKDLKTDQVVDLSNGLPSGFYSISLLNSNGSPFSPELQDIPFDRNGYNYNLQVSYTYPTASWSYSFYNDAGELVASIAPEGIKAIWQNVPTDKNNIPFLTTYEYGLDGHLVAKEETDEGRTEYVYRKDGQIRFSQNEVQRRAIPKRFSYVNYDGFGRSVESGELEPFTDISNIHDISVSVIESVASDGGLNEGTRRDWVHTYFDEAPWPLPTEWSDKYIVDYTYGKVAASENPNSRTWYSYDEQGRMHWMLQDIKGLGTKMVEYTYDLSGHVLEVAYQKGKSDAFYHYYTYDDDLRLKTVYTSRDGQQRDLQATYYYYLHGPLKRVELADKLQGIDYVYTIQGWLKSINHPNKVNDPGKDGIANTANAAFAPDAFGVQLDYFSGDYIRSNTNIASFNSLSTGNTLLQNQYNGNIRTQTWFNQKSLSAIGRDGEQINNPQSITYLYDKQYQLTEATFALPDFSNNSLQLLDKYQEFGIKYDLHGNIKFLKRRGVDGAIVDDFTYNYLPNSNRLQSVGNYRSYQYDEMGQMISEVGAGQGNYVEYNANGLINAVYSDEVKSQLKATFSYTAGGERYKKVDFENGNILYSVYGSSGLLATYLIENGVAVVKDFPIYGLKPIGTYSEESEKFTYELSNHTGTVLGSISRTKESGLADVLSYSDFTALGLPAEAGGEENQSYGYQGAYSGKDTQLGWNTFELRMYDSRIGRWLSIDPQQQYWSPYVSMGNNWPNRVDPTGGEDDWHLENGVLKADKGDTPYSLYLYFKNQGKNYSYEQVHDYVNDLSHWDGNMTAGDLQFMRYGDHSLDIIPLADNYLQFAGAYVNVAGNTVLDYLGDNIEGLKSLGTAQGWKNLGNALATGVRYITMTDSELHKKIDYKIADAVEHYSKSFPKKTTPEKVRDVVYGASTIGDAVFGSKATGLAKKAALSTKVGQKAASGLSAVNKTVSNFATEKIQAITRSVGYTARNGYPVYVKGISFKQSIFAERIKGYTTLLDELFKSGVDEKFLQDFQNASESFFKALNEDLSLLDVWKSLDGGGFSNLKKSTEFITNKGVLNDLSKLTDDTRKSILRTLDGDADLLAEINKNPSISKAWVQHKVEAAVTSEQLAKASEAISQIENATTKQKALDLLTESAKKQQFIERNILSKSFDENVVGELLKETFGEDNIAAQVHLWVIDNKSGLGTKMIADFFVRLPDGSFAIFDSKYHASAEVFSAANSLTDNQAKVLNLLQTGGVRSIEIRSPNLPASFNLPYTTKLPNPGKTDFVLAKSVKGQQQVESFMDLFKAN